MSLLENKDIWKYVEKGSFYISPDPSCDYVKFHLFYNPSKEIVCFTAYPRIITYNGFPTLYTDGYDPKYFLLVSDVEKEKIQKLSNEIREITSGDFLSEDVICKLNEILNLEEDKIPNLMKSNKEAQLKKELGFMQTILYGQRLIEGASSIPESVPYIV